MPKTANNGLMAIITSEDISRQVSDKVFKGGQSLSKDIKSVVDPRATQSGGAIAWVMGGSRYAARLEMKAGKLQTTCTCPSGCRCKHTVALALRLIELQNQGKNLPQADPGDWRLILTKTKPEFKSQSTDELSGKQNDSRDFTPSSIV